MIPEDQLLLTCLRQDFTSDHARAVCELVRSRTFDWDRIVRTADKQGVTYLIYHNLSICQAEGLDIPDHSIQKLRLGAYRNIIAKELQFSTIIRALSFFQDMNLEVMLIKGAALDCSVYKNPSYVLSDDIDIIIHSQRENFSQPEITKINDFFYKQGVEFDFFSHHDLDLNGLLHIDYKSIWDRATRAEYRGYPLFLMSPVDLLISLCINSNRQRYFRLKSLFDISETIQSVPDISWQKLAERARAFGCENIIYTALLVTHLTTKCKLSPGWDNNFRIGAFRQRLISKIINFQINHALFYPYPSTGLSVTGRPLHISILLPYISYSRAQILKKVTYAIRVHGT